MPIVSTYSVSPILTSREFTTIDELLTQLPDNTTNSIDAIHVRDAVYTLWERLGDVQTIASQSASASVFYTSPIDPITGTFKPVPQTQGGITSGSTFSGATMQEMWDTLLYPYSPPGRSISVNGSSWTTLGVSNTKEWGDPDTDVPISWSVTKNSKYITNISVASAVASVTAPGNSQAGTKPSNPAGMSTATINVGGSYTISVSDDGGATNYSATLNVGYMHAVYWGKWPNNSSIPTFSGWAGGAPGYTPIKPSWADGASVGSGKKLATSITGTYDGINGAGQYLVFAWPTFFLPTGMPVFKQDGLTNTAWTKIGSAVPFINRFSFNSAGGGIPYDIWITNTAYNSAVSSFKIELP